MVIRPATEKDIYIIHQLAHKIWWNVYKGIISDEQIQFMLDTIYSEHALNEQMQEGTDFLLIEFAGKPGGFASYALTDQQNHIFKLHKLYILPVHHGSGHGKVIIEYVTDLCHSKGGKVLELNVNRKNPAFEFYKKVGFQIYQIADIPYHGFMLNDYVMRKNL